jgi:hypothetical protein
LELAVAFGVLLAASKSDGSGWLVLAGLLFFGWLVVQAIKGSRRAARERDDALRRQWVNEALSCRKCRGLAYPIFGTRNRYRCDCGNQFAGSKHSF